MTPAILQSKYQQSVTNQIRLIYIGLFLGVLLCLTARNVFIRLRTLYFRNFKSPQANTDEKFKYSDGSFLTPSTTRAFKHWLSNPLAYAAYFTPIELMLLLVVTVINVTSVLVVTTRIQGVHSEFPNTPRAVSLRAANQAVAQMPIVFGLTGRNSIVSFLTGFQYQQSRFAHKLFVFQVMPSSAAGTVAGQETAYNAFVNMVFVPIFGAGSESNCDLAVFASE